MNMGPLNWEAADSPYRPRKDMDIVIMPCAIELAQALNEDFSVGAQGGRAEDKGAFTGDVSVKMLKDLGCHYILCGHSERRQHHGETDDMVRAQTLRALEVGLQPVVCVGETRAERDAGQAEEVVIRQLQGIPSDAIIAYEPVWAIGTGLTPEANEAAAMHKLIRAQFPGDEGKQVRILYGGSITPMNSVSMLLEDDVDGGLVGGASLDPISFKIIADTLHKIKLEDEQ